VRGLGRWDLKPYYDRVTVLAEFDSYSRNGEDVVLRRTFAGIVEAGRYIDVGAHEPRIGSISAAFYDQGWTGITVEPEPRSAALHRTHRPRDIQIEAAAAGSNSESVALHVVDGTGLSTLDDSYARMRAASGFRSHDIPVRARTMNTILDEANWAGLDIHFMSVSTEGSEVDVISGLDLQVWRPWVLAIEVVGPEGEHSRRQDIEKIVGPAGYHVCLFDGLSCFYAADEHAERLAPRLSVPAGVLDNFTTPALRRYRAKAEALPALMAEVVRWRSQALTWWAEAMSHADDEDWRQRYTDLTETFEIASAELENIYQSRFWRVTEPLRIVLAARSRTRNVS